MRVHCANTTESDSAVTTTPTFGPIFTEIRKRSAQYLLWRGIFGVIIGLLLIFFPFGSAIVLSIFVGAWMIVDGLVAAGEAFDLKKADAPWGWTLTAGIITAIAGVAILFIPGIFALVSAMFILIFMAIGLVFSGISQLNIPKALRSGWTITAGILNIIFGLVLLVLSLTNPADNVWTLAIVAGVFALVMGISSIIFSVRLRRSNKENA